VCSSDLTSTVFLGANTTTTRKFLLSQGTGSAGVAPFYDILQPADIPNNAANTTGTASNLSGTPTLPNGTKATTQTATDNTTAIATDAFVQAVVSTIPGQATGTGTGIEVFGVGTGSINMPPSLPTYYAALVGPNSGTPNYLWQLPPNPATTGGFMSIGAPVNTTVTLSDGSQTTLPVSQIQANAVSGDVAFSGTGAATVTGLNGSPANASGLGVNIPFVNLPQTWSARQTFSSGITGRITGLDSVSSGGAQASAGTGATCSVTGNTDAFTLTWTFGSGQVPGTFCRVNYSSYNPAPKVVFSQNDLATAAIIDNIAPSGVATSALFFTTNLTGNTGTYSINVHLMQ
jgi:hypothetical protein